MVVRLHGLCLVDDVGLQQHPKVRVQMRLNEVVSVICVHTHTFRASAHCLLPLVDPGAVMGVAVAEGEVPRCSPGSC